MSAKRDYVDAIIIELHNQTIDRLRATEKEIAKHERQVPGPYHTRELAKLRPLAEALHIVTNKLDAIRGK